MATKEKTKTEQIFEAAQSAYDSCKALRNTVEAMMRSQGVNPQELKKKTAGVYLDPKKLSDKDAFMAGVMLTDIGRKVAKQGLNPQKTSSKLPSKLRARI